MQKCSHLHLNGLLEMVIIFMSICLDNLFLHPLCTQMKAVIYACATSKQCFSFGLTSFFIFSFSFTLHVKCVFYVYIFFHNFLSSKLNLEIFSFDLVWLLQPTLKSTCYSHNLHYFLSSFQSPHRKEFLLQPFRCHYVCLVCLVYV